VRGNEVTSIVYIAAECQAERGSNPELGAVSSQRKAECGRDAEAQQSQRSNG